MQIAILASLLIFLSFPIELAPAFICIFKFICSSLLESLSTSSSSSFVANNSGHINIYQAVADAAEFLADIHASGRSKAFHSERLLLLFSVFS